MGNFFIIVVLSFLKWLYIICNVLVKCFLWLIWFVVLNKVIVFLVKLGFLIFMLKSGLC